MRNLYTILVCLLAIGCVPEEPLPETASIIHTGPGPEDLVHDKYEGRDRLLISFSSRGDAPDYGEIEVYEIGPEDTLSSIIPRINLPASIPFHPHGIDIIEREGHTYLYVVNHYRDDDETSSILVFRVEEEGLYFENEIKHNLISTPNSVTPRSNGGFYITNDGAATAEAMLEFLFNAYNGSVVYCDYNGTCNKVAGQLAYPNGINWQGDELYVSTTAQKAIFQYDIIEPNLLSSRHKIAPGLGYDNLRTHDEPYLITTQHIDLVAFLLHSSNGDIVSPFKIVAMDKDTGELTVLFYSNGSLMSGASTGLIVEEDLYIGQVFGSFILQVRDIGL